MENKAVLPSDGAPESGQLENGRIWLNTAPVVDQLIRDFTMETLGLIGGPDFMARLDFACRRMNNLFLNVAPSDDYERGPWNAPAHLGEHVLMVLRVEGETRLAVRDAFMVYTSALLNVADSDAEFDSAVIEPLIANWRSALLGLDAVPFRQLGKF
ncbi:hypothetical protein PQQ52_00450 [Paraburkholderia sediminicola]|uniref:hypothetical protein n=1 Tax=Paraburkholderia sediminicola TaxID=458836 RepID=UPI0038B7914D